MTMRSLGPPSIRPRSSRTVAVAWSAMGLRTEVRAGTV